MNRVGGGTDATSLKKEIVKQFNKDMYEHTRSSWNYERPFRVICKRFPLFRSEEEEPWIDRWGIHDEHWQRYTRLEAIDAFNEIIDTNYLDYRPEYQRVRLLYTTPTHYKIIKEVEFARVD